MDTTKVDENFPTSLRVIFKSNTRLKEIKILYGLIFAFTEFLSTTVSSTIEANSLWRIFSGISSGLNQVQRSFYLNFDLILWILSILSTLVKWFLFLPFTSSHMPLFISPHLNVSIQNNSLLSGK